MAPKATSGKKRSAMIALEIDARSSKKGCRRLPMETLLATQFIPASRNPDVFLKGQLNPNHE
jgi:hypothetical protein